MSDFKRDVSRAYGVLNEEGYSDRSTFIIDRQGKITSIEVGESAISVDTSLHACKVLY